jgi:DNA-binding transcriptional LysR family regulator
MRRRLPSLNALHAFETAARLGRMTLAGDALNVTHGAVSRHVRHLEQVLGAKLFEGPKHALRLTEAGRALLPHLTAGFDDIEAGVRKVTETAQQTLDVSCLGTFTMRWLIPRLHRFAAVHPAVDVRLSASDAPLDFQRERYAVGIRVTDHPMPPDCAVTELFAEHVGPVVSPALAAKLRLKRATDLAAAPLLHTRTRPGAWAAWLRRQERPTPVGRVFEHFYFMLEAAVAGLGVGIAPWPLVSDDVRAGRLVAPLGFRPSGVNYVAVRRNRRDRLAQALCDWLREEAEQTPKAPRK